MGRRDQGRLFYEFRLADPVLEHHLLRRMNVFVTAALANLHKELEPHYSDIGRPSVDPELGRTTRCLHLPLMASNSEPAAPCTMGARVLPCLEARLRRLLRAKCCIEKEARKIPRDLHEDARDIARRKMKARHSSNRATNASGLRCVSRI